MSYATMDHGGWVQQQIKYGRTGRKPSADNTKGWHAAPDQLNEFQLKVFDILGMTFGGIYNAPITWKSVQWKGWWNGIAVPVRCGGLSTFDYARLTYLVFLCHAARIRCEIRPHSFNLLLLVFHPRAVTGGSAVRHPSLGEAVAAFHAYLPAGHRIRAMEPTHD